MPSILNLKFKGNKSFVPFSNLSDADALTKTWKVCTKVASFLEQGQRLENLSWRLWHLQNLMVDSDNAKSKRDFKKLSKCMGDKLDKEKGRSIEELQAPGFRRNQSTTLIQQRAAEKEREREASQNGIPGTIHRMQFTFSVDQPAAPTASSAPTKKPDLKPSAEFKDSIIRRGRPTTRSSGTSNSTTTVVSDSTKGVPLSQSGRKPDADSNQFSSANDSQHHVSLHFPSLFSNDFGPAALLYPTPTLTNAMSYGEGVGMNTNTSDGFSIPRPTIELPLDDLLNADSPTDWSSFNRYDANEDVDMKPSNVDSAYASDERSSDDDALLTSTTSVHDIPSLAHTIEDVLPRTITPSRLGPTPGPTDSSISTRKPSLNLRTQSVSTRSSGLSATPVNSLGAVQQSSNNSAPGGVKAECSNCGATHTPLWRRGLNDELNCNACGLYCKLHKRPRPKSMRNSHGEGRSQTAPRQESQEIVAQCYNCHTTATPLWRKDDEGKTVCNACGLYYKLHGSARPISMKSDVIRKRARHDARRSGAGVSETPSASPGASRRASPSAEATPTLAPDSTTASYSNDELEYNTSAESELMGALGSTQNNGNHNHQNSNYASQGSYTLHIPTFPGPYHPDYLPQLYNMPADALPFASGDGSDEEHSQERTSKRRRLSTDSMSEPPSSATSYSSYSGSFTSASSATSHSQRSSMDYQFGNFSNSFSMMSNNGSTFWHPPLLPPRNSPHVVHPPMLPPEDARWTASEDSPMDFLHPPMLQPDEADVLFATYLHPPMLPPDESPRGQLNSLQLHPPMLPNDWHGHDFYDSHMHSGY